MSWGWRPSGLPHPCPSRPRRLHCPPGCPGPSPGQAAEKQAWVWSSGPGQSCSTRSLGGEQRRLRACTPGPHVRLQGSHGLQGPQAPQPCSSGEEPASPSGPQSGRPSHTWGDVGQSSFLVGGTMALPAAPLTPPSPAGSRCRGHQGRSTLGREPGSHWGLLELTAPLRGREEKAPLGRGRPPPHASPSIREPKSHYHRPVHPRPGDSQGPRRRAALGAGTLGEPKHRGRGPRMGAAG